MEKVLQIPFSMILQMKRETGMEKDSGIFMN